jgi:hypothetical protein
MITDKQLLANRANAQKSTGPRTAAGKAVSRLNAVKHALTGQLTIVAPEQYAAFTGLSTRLTADLNPSGEQEFQVAHRIVRDTWRLARAAANEENVYALGLMDQAETERVNDLVITQTIDPNADPVLTAAISDARTYFNKIRDFDRASLYEQRLKRGLVQDYKLFHQLQKDRIYLETHPRALPVGSVLSTPLTAPFSFPIDRKIEPQIVNPTHPYVSPNVSAYPPPPPPPILDPYWPF